MRRLAVVAVGLVLGFGAATLAIAHEGGDESGGHARTAPARSTTGERVTPAEANRRVLTAAQTRRLVRYAKTLYACLVSRGIDVASPRKGRREITIEAAEPLGLKRLVAEMTPCAEPLGPPPGPSSLQAVDAQTIVISVPKRCLLDPKTELTATT